VSERSVADEPVGEVNNVIAHALLSYVEAALGRDGLEQLGARLTGSPDVARLTEASRWWPREEFNELVLAAIEVTGDADLGRRVGEQSFRNTLGGSGAAMLLTSETPEVACAVMADYSTRVTKGRVLSVAESTDRHVMLEGRYTDGFPPSRFSCGFTCGYFASLPSLFDQLGVCVETSCQERGDDLCRFRVSWRPDPARASAVSQPDDVLFRGTSALDELENHHLMAAWLVESHEIDDVLERIVNSVSAAVGAPQYVLAVRLDDGTGRRVHQMGFEGDGAEVLADMLDAGEPLGNDCLVTEVAYGSDFYGHLVAVFLPGASATPLDRRLLGSYAHFAAAAIRTVEALDAAKRDRDTATAMLGLAAALAETSGVQSVVTNLCAALPAATGCDVGSVWLADPETGDVVLVEATDKAGKPLPIDDPAARFDPMNVPVTREPLTAPVVLDHEHPDLRATFGDVVDPYVEWAIVPIGPVDGLIAVAGASFERRLATAERNGIGDRLRGLADQALVAFENARLIEVMRHQALHDDLTGLPKRVLAEDRCRQALTRRERTGEEVALLFVDVDDFKAINDTHGHALGDELLQAVAERLSGALRSSDTCARVGGDEFVVILTGPSGSPGGREVAERLTRALEEPFHLGGQTIRVTASIGVAWAGDEVVTFDDLVVKADAAMYEAKAQGKARLVISR
jgi:diguanylate cyclase (GGDEF)-like protein